MPTGVWTGNAYVKGDKKPQEDRVQPIAVWPELAVLPSRVTAFLKEDQVEASLSQATSSMRHGRCDGMAVKQMRELLKELLPSWFVCDVTIFRKSGGTQAFWRWNKHGGKSMRAQLLQDQRLDLPFAHMHNCLTADWLISPRPVHCARPARAGELPGAAWMPLELKSLSESATALLHAPQGFFTLKSVSEWMVVSLYNDDGGWAEHCILKTEAIDSTYTAT